MADRNATSPVDAKPARPSAWRTTHPEIFLKPLFDSSAMRFFDLYVSCAHFGANATTSRYASMAFLAWAAVA